MKKILSLTFALALCKIALAQDIEHDFKGLVDTVHANKEYIIYTYGKPDTTSNNELGGQTFTYYKRRFDLKFNDQGTLKSFVKYPAGQKMEATPYLSQLIKKYGKVKGTDIYYHQVSLGMTANMVIKSVGYPQKINKTTTAHLVHEQWIYNNKDLSQSKYYYLSNGKVTAIQD